MLDDPQARDPALRRVLLIAPKRVDDQALLDALRPLIGAIDVTMMREANLRAARRRCLTGASRALALERDQEKKRLAITLGLRARSA